MNYVKFLLGLCLGLLILVIPIAPWQSTPLDSLSTLAVQLDGRKKPLQTVAWETVTKIHGSPRYQISEGNTLEALPTYLSLWFNDRDWNQEAFILLNYRPLKEQVGLDPERKYFSFQELVNSPLAAVVAEARHHQAQDQDLTRNQRQALILEERLALMLQTVGRNRLPLVPHPSDPKGAWLSLPDAPDTYGPEQIAPLMATFQQIQQIYQASPEHLGMVGQLAPTLRPQLASLSPTVYPPRSVLEREVFWQRLHPFGKAWKLYGAALIVLLGVITLKRSEWYWGSLGLFAAGLLIHSYGFILRMQIAGRPPVTNMYESVIWVGLGIAVLGFGFELCYRVRSYLLAAAPLAMLCLVLADSLPTVLDASIQPLVPVLRDNFWLSVHVPTITLSYAGFALAFGLGHLTLGQYLFRASLQEPIARLSQLNYRVLQVGVLLLTTGIILGGIWAHFSWGRFWGWDPKETWALIALLCYLVPLHGRLLGWLGHFGLAVASVVCFNAVLMAWYGVNFVLGTGLHSYGFGTGGSELLVAGLVGLDLLFVLGATVRYQKGGRSRSKPDSRKLPKPLAESPAQPS